MHPTARRCSQHPIWWCLHMFTWSRPTRITPCTPRPLYQHPRHLKYPILPPLIYIYIYPRFTLPSPGSSIWNADGMDGFHKIGYGFSFHGMKVDSTPIPWSFHTHSMVIPHPFHAHSTPIPHPFHTHSMPIPPPFHPHSMVVPWSFHLESMEWGLRVEFICLKNVYISLYVKYNYKSIVKIPCSFHMDSMESIDNL